MCEGNGQIRSKPGGLVKIRFCEHEDVLAFLEWAPATKECSLEKGTAYSSYPQISKSHSRICFKS